MQKNIHHPGKVMDQYVIKMVLDFSDACPVNHEKVGGKNKEFCRILQKYSRIPHEFNWCFRTRQWITAKIIISFLFVFVIVFDDSNDCQDSCDRSDDRPCDFCDHLFQCHCVCDLEHVRQDQDQDRHEIHHD